jgi:predicted kinase
MSDSLPLLVIVTGAPATGKTTIARSLAKEMGLPLVSKDAIKEELYDNLEDADPSDSHRLGYAAIKLMFSWVRTMLEANVSMILESNFHRTHSTDDLEALFAISRPVLVQCDAPTRHAIDRYIARSEKGERHPVHDDANRVDELRADLERGEYDLRMLNAPSITIDTSENEDPDIGDLARRIRALVAGEPDH